MMFFHRGLGVGSAFYILYLLITAGLRECAKPHVSEQHAGSSLEGLLQYEVVYPQRVDSAGRFISNLVSHHMSRIGRREAADGGAGTPRVFYSFRFAGQDLLLNLTLNPHLLASGFLVERRSGGLRGSALHAYPHSMCHFLGEVRGRSAAAGQAAVSTCNGLTGLFRISEEDFFIRPLQQTHIGVEPQGHIIYKQYSSQASSQLEEPFFMENPSNGTCGVREPQGSATLGERQRERWERRQHRRRQRSISREKWVETLVVADQKMVEYHGRSSVETYVLAVMNIVAGLFRDASIGNSINIVVVRLILLEQDEEDLKITHHADNSLSSFCKWQKRLNTKGDEHPVHHDVAVLLTRKDICAATNKPCETLGLSHVAGMCQPHRSCSISEDTGLPLAFTIAHELGHNFGIQHDGSGNNCEPVGKRPLVMSPRLLYGTSPPNWSRCSRQYITRFLDRGWGWCLDDPPGRNKLATPTMLPGVLYNAAHQCRLQYGSSSQPCDDVDNVCSTLWCTVDSTCHSKLDGAVDGTRCGEGKWCLSGDCVEVERQPQTVDGGWEAWSEWSTCSRTCGAGVQNAQRDCVSPAPRNGGKYCLGERRRYRICNQELCSLDQPSFRYVQCSRFNTVPYKGRFYKWMHINNRINPCELHCRPVNEYFSEKMMDAVIDGTRCYEDSWSRDMCINGICKSIGCDYEIDSSAMEDRCGVCHGNGSTCETVHRTFEETEGLGYVDIGLIPQGARDILIQEVAEAGNFLALRSNDPEKYFLNGGWTIQWNGEYKVAGTVFTYERTGHLENLTSPGPTMEPVWIQLLFQETNPGVRYEYTINRDILPAAPVGTPASDFYWKHGAWTECSVSCGTGVKRQVVHCIERMSGIVAEHYCDVATRPDDRRVSCSMGPCPAMWWAGEWQKCSVSCGDSGLTRRTVVCVQSVGLDEQQALQPSACQHLRQPETFARCNTHVACPSDWSTGNWSQCSASCSSGVQIREVTCSWNTGADCVPEARPATSMPCSMDACPTNADEWSGSGSSSKEIFNEINSFPDDNHLPKFGPGMTRAQPRGSDGLSNVIKGDFSYHQHIESDNSINNNVPVDDFYYDYNFIKFHEDLLYDFEKEGKSVSDYSGIKVDQELKPRPTSSWHKDGLYTVTSVARTTANPLPASTSLSTAAPPKSSSDLSAESSSEGDGVFTDDYFLPVAVTTRPRLPVTRFSQRRKEGTRDLSTVGSPVPTDEVPSEGVRTTLQDTVPNIHMTRGTLYHTYASKDNERVAQSDATEMPATQNDKASVTVGTGEEDFGEDVPGGESDWERPLQEEVSHQTGISSEANEGTFAGLTTPLFKWDTASRDIPSSPLPYASEMYSSRKYAVTEPSANVAKAGENSTTLDKVSQEIPNLPENRHKMTSAAGLEPLPHADVPGSSQPPPWISTQLPTIRPDAESWPSHTVTPAVTQLPGDTTPSPSWAEIDYNVIIFRPSLGLDDLSSSPTPTVPLAQAPSSHRTVLAEAHTPSPLRSPMIAIWITGSWSACSTSCGLGAVWRPVRCSTGNDSDCDLAKRPAPARRCYLRPCAAWRASQWSKCSKNCGGGVKVRETQCYDVRDQRLLRPFHCQAVSLRPPGHMPCNTQPCLDWYASSWGQCSELCGGGEQQRLVACPEAGRCEEMQKPSHIQPCNSHPCTQWVTGSWGQCSVSCGGGVQRRLVKCVNTKAEQDSQEEEQAQCDHEPWPENTRPCNLQDCDSAPSGQLCLRDRLTFRLCQTLQLLGQCYQATVRTQCCKTCEQRNRGNDRATRR
ncbi:A disintegrin and metalloproteinase with thrombospondin motifs 7 isoform X1 [Electrophorus electricus]|uniref:A disintegrin and metalloproteinase with thrombospondin motifs 7 isoform X1 n=1 Tax=Electrophorus electricus TaxID=8005 RepID=UPI0015D03E55|nr:A disintegrin and metalloproteinase with thrombospondin motifs 7 isoform X1 [Electrophorus electricus]